MDVGQFGATLREHVLLYQKMIIELASSYIWDVLRAFDCWATLSERRCKRQGFLRASVRDNPSLWPLLTFYFPPLPLPLRETLKTGLT